MAYSYEPHTADITLVASGRSIEEAFSEAARGLTHIMTEDDVQNTKSFPISVESESKESLFFDYLDELITLLDTESLFVHHAELEIEESDEGWKLSGKIFGDLADKYEHHGDVKAPTYHAMSVSENKGIWVLRATLDL